MTEWLLLKLAVRCFKYTDFFFENNCLSNVPSWDGALILNIYPIDLIILF